MSFVLASQSPRRRRLLELSGFAFRACPADVDETVLPDEAPEDYVLRLALAKARAAAHLAADGEAVVAADTTVVADGPDGGRILGKPSDPAQAVEMLRMLRARPHRVLTALAVLPVSGEPLTEICVSTVVMRAYSDAEIETYVAGGDPLDKAGAYAIQHAGFHPVERIEGCYANIVGLPVCRLTGLLQQAGLESAARICVPEPGVPCRFMEMDL